MQKGNSINLDNEAHELLSQYKETIDKYKSKKDPAFTMRSFVNNLIKEYFKDRIVTDNGIKLETPLIFATDLFYENCINIEATKRDFLLDNINPAYGLKEVPNNLDTWNGQTYCYNGDERKHRGIKQYVTFTCDGKYHLNVVYMVFDMFLDENETRVYISNVESSRVRMLFSNSEGMTKDLTQMLLRNEEYIYKKYFELRMSKEREVLNKIVKGEGEYDKEQYREIADRILLVLADDFFEGVPAPHLVEFVPTMKIDLEAEKKYFSND